MGQSPFYHLETLSKSFAHNRSPQSTDIKATRQWHLVNE